MVIVDVMGDFAPLEDLLDIAKDLKFAHLAKREFRLVSVRMERGEYVASAVSATSGPCPQLAYQTETAIDYLNYGKTPGGAAIIYPDKLEGPDLHNEIQDKNTGKIVDVVTQAKLSVRTDGVRNDVCRKGVESLEPSRFHQRYDKKEEAWVHMTQYGPDIQKQWKKMRKARYPGYTPPKLSKAKMAAELRKVPDMIPVLAIAGVPKSNFFKEHKDVALMKLHHFLRLFGSTWPTSLKRSRPQPPMPRLS